MVRKIEITLSVIIILLMIFTLGINSEYRKSSEKDAENLYSKIDQLNENTIKLSPPKPNIEIFAVNEISKSNTMEGTVYNCVTWSPFTDQTKTYPLYDIVRIFIRNEGSETSKLKIDLDECMKGTKIFKLCSENGQEAKFVMKEGPYKIVEIERIGKINPQVVTLIYIAEGSPAGCNISYSSEEIIYNQSYVEFTIQN